MKTTYVVFYHSERGHLATNPTDYWVKSIEDLRHVPSPLNAHKIIFKDDIEEETLDIVFDYLDEGYQLFDVEVEYSIKEKPIKR